MAEVSINSARHFSVLMAVYAGEQPANLGEALESLCLSDEMPTEVVIVEDGQLPQELHAVLDQYRRRLPIVSVKLTINMGLARALDTGLKNCKFELVARFDSDDISMPSRFTEQLDFLGHNAKIAAVGAWVEEFESGSPIARSLRVVPANPVELKTFAKLRNPFNHPAVMFRRSIVMQVGGYQDEPAFEDYSLWLRMLQAGFQIANIPRALVRMRAGPGQTKRRMGLQYARNELKFAAKFYRLGYFTWAEYLKFIACRIPLRLLPITLLRRAYLRFGRVVNPA